MKFRLVVLCVAFSLIPFSSGAERLRLIVETDAGGDPDDEQSLVRLVLYANDFDIQNIIANRPVARDGENKNPERTGLGIVRRIVNAYDQCYPMLVKHDTNYPRGESLLSRVIPGYNDTDQAVRAIIGAVDSPDPQPLWYMDWGTDHGGATNNLQRALDRVLAERGADGYAKFKTNINVIFPSRLLTNHTEKLPPWRLWVNTWEPPVDGKRWYHRFSALTAIAGGFNVEKHLAHHLLGNLYPTNTTHPQKEGDTMSFLYLVPVGFNEPTEPLWGSWAGRYGPDEDYPGLPYYWANRMDIWKGSTNRDNTVARWATAIQNDFRARLDWCVKPPAECNHPPHLKVRAKEITGLNVEVGVDVTLTADPKDWTDPDPGQKLRFEWILYPEPSTYRPQFFFTGIPNAAVIRLPNEAAGKMVHLILAATDNGEPALTRYQRVILKVGEKK